MKTKIIKFKIDKKSIDRVQQETLSEEQWIWLKERVLRDLLDSIYEDFDLNFNYNLESGDNYFTIELIK